MKKTIFAGVVLLVLAVLTATGRLWSQEKMPPVKPDTRIGFINLTAVITNYDKYKTYKDEMKAEAKPYEERIKEFQERVESLKKEYDLTDPLSPRREEIEKALKQAQADIQKQSDEAKKLLSDKATKQMVVIYKEVRSTCTRYAKAHDLEAVIQYNEPVVDTELDGAPNVERKMSAGALISLYLAPGLDITDEITTAINSRK